MDKFKAGDLVTKVTGDYSFDGVVDTVFQKQSGEERLVVEDERGALHVYSAGNLRHIGNMADHQYLRVLKKLLDKGVYREGRNGGTYGLFGEQMRFDLSAGFPLLTTKKVHFKSIVVELLWFLRGETNIKYLKDHGVSIWDEWADKDGNLGPVYGSQWRSWPGKAELIPDFDDDYGKFSSIDTIGNSLADYKLIQRPIDQLANVIDAIRSDPHGRRHIVSAWNPAEIDEMALPPCHCLFQFHVANGKLSCQLYQRSADWFLGVPFNIASYALLTHLIAREAGLDVGDFVHTFGDLHLYANHIDQAKEQLSRQPRALPQLDILLTDERSGTIFGHEPSDFSLIGYDPHPAIKANVSV